MSHRRRNSVGFTLIELILVMVILTLVLATVAPSLRGLAVGRRAGDSAAAIVSLAEYARSQSVTEARSYRLNFDSRTNDVWLTADHNDGTFASLSSDFGKRVVSAAGIRISCDVTARQDGQYIQFQPDGRTDPARIVVSDQMGHSIAVACPSAAEMFRVESPGDEVR